MSGISAKYQKDYKNMDYKNPRLVKDQKVKQKRFFRVVIGLAIAFILAFIYLLFYSPVFTINEIQVNGLEKVNKQNFDLLVNNYRFDHTLLIFPNNNFWMFDKKEVIDRIFAEYYFEEFNIKKKWPNKIIINLKEKQSAINWLTNNLCYHLDLTGLAIEYCEENDGYLIIKDLSNKDVRIGGEAIDAQGLNYLIELYAQTKKIVSDSLVLIEVEKENNLLTLKTEQGTDLRFNEKLPISEQVGRLYTLISQQDVKGRIATMKYFDLRFGEKVYYQ